MRRAVGLTIAVVFTLSVAAAGHVVVRPRASMPGAEERYAVRVPTEGDVATTSVRLEIPVGVTVLEVQPADAATFGTHTEGGRIVSITWEKEIPPKESAEFFFRARNPEGRTELAWKAFQYFADGTVAEWIGPAGDRRPASVTTLGDRAGGP